MMDLVDELLWDIIWLVVCFVWWIYLKFGGYI